MASIFLAESLLRLSSLIFAAMAACLLGLNKETEVVIVERTASVKDILAFWSLMIVASVAGAYHSVQFCKCLILGKSAKYRTYKKWEACVSLVFDQVVMYAMYATLATAIQAALICVTGQEQFQWMEMPGMYKRYSHQAGGGLACAVIASGSMSFLNIISSHQCFSLYLSNPKISSCC